SQPAARLPLQNGVDPVRSKGTLLGIGRQAATPPHPFGLLRPRRERPRCRATKQRDELATPHGSLQSEDDTLPHRCRNAALCATAKLAANGRDGSVASD